MIGILSGEGGRHALPTNEARRFGLEHVKDCLVHVWLKSHRMVVLISLMFRIEREIFHSCI